MLGSCVGVAIYDRVAKTGGMCHVMLPSSKEGRGDRGKFADTALDWLVEDVVSAGTERSRLTAKITGGASMFGEDIDNGIGNRNINAVKEKLSQLRIRIVAEEVGGNKGRRMTLDPGTGKVQVQVIGAEPKTI